MHFRERANIWQMCKWQILYFTVRDYAAGGSFLI